MHARKKLFESMAPKLEHRIDQVPLTQNIRNVLPDVLEEFQIKTLVDAPCGDRNWIRTIDYSFETYTGVDIEHDMIETLKTEFPNYNFLVRDITTEILPSADALLCRDFFVHLPLNLIWSALTRIKLAGFKYIVTTSFTTRTRNTNIKIGAWFPLNLQASPFNFPKPLKTFTDVNHTTTTTQHDKCLGVWNAADIPGYPD